MKVIALFLCGILAIGCSTTVSEPERSSGSAIGSAPLTLQGSVSLDHSEEAFEIAGKRIRANSRFHYRDGRSIVSAVSSNEVVVLSPAGSSHVRLTRYRVKGKISNKMKLQMSYLKFQDYQRRLKSEGKWNSRGTSQYPGQEGRFAFSGIRTNERVLVSELAGLF